MRTIQLLTFLVLTLTAKISFSQANSKQLPVTTVHNGDTVKLFTLQQYDWTLLGFAQRRDCLTSLKAAQASIASLEEEVERLKKAVAAAMATTEVAGQIKTVSEELTKVVEIRTRKQKAKDWLRAKWQALVNWILGIIAAVETVVIVVSQTQGL